MQSQEAAFLLDFFAPQLADEFKTTRRVLAAVPEDQKNFRPALKSRSAIELVRHIVGSEIWFLDGILKGEFGQDFDLPAEIDTAAGVVAAYEQKVPALIERLKSLTPERLATPINFFGLFNNPAVAYLSFMLVHSVHHRGQLSAYLRPMGAKVPDIYGGSADEPFQMPAEAASPEKT